MDCWRHHELCALLSARDLMETRAAYAKAQAGQFRTAIDKLNRTAPETPEEVLIEAARRTLEEYHKALRSGRER